MRLTDPLVEDESAPIYTPTQAVGHLTEDGRAAYVVPSSVEWGRDFVDMLNKTTPESHRFLVGSWHNEVWLVYATKYDDTAKQVAEHLGLEITDTGPIAHFGEDEPELFPLQPTDNVYAIAQTGHPDSEGGGDE
jgi:hypothetical protein